MKATSFQQFHEIGKHEHVIPPEACCICGRVSHAYGRHNEGGKVVQTCQKSCEELYTYRHAH
jgi:hypothetical protein